MKGIAFVLAMTVPCLSAETPPATSPAGQPAATSQPVRTVARYYSLIKNEFMRTEEGDPVLVPEEVHAAIAEIRRQAAEDKRLVDGEIASLTREINAADADRRASEADARAHAKSARESKREGTRYTARNYRGTILFNKHEDSTKLSQAKTSRAQEAASKAQAAVAKGDIKAMRAELIQLKKESAALAVVASPYNRNLPPKTFWTDLPEEIQKSLDRTGITLDQFNDLIKTCGMSEDRFLDEAARMEKKSKNADDLGDLLVQVFASKMPGEQQMNPDAHAGYRPAARPQSPAEKSQRVR